MVTGGRGLALPRQDVQDDVGGMDALAQGLGAGGLDRRQAIAQHGGEDVDHLPVAIVGCRPACAAPAPALAGSIQSLNGAPFRSAPGLRASTGT